MSILTITSTATATSIETRISIEEIGTRSTRTGATVQAVTASRGSTIRNIAAGRRIRIARQLINMEGRHAATRCPAGNQMPVSKSTGQVGTSKAAIEADRERAALLLTTAVDPELAAVRHTTGADQDTTAVDPDTAVHPPTVLAVARMAVQIRLAAVICRAVMGAATAVMQWGAVHAVITADPVRPAVAAVGPAVWDHAAAAAVGGGRKMNWRIYMTPRNFLGCVYLLFACFLLAGNISAQQASTTPTPVIQGRAFATPEEAANALIEAADKFDTAALEQIFGPEAKDLVITAEAPRDKEIARTFAELAKEKKSISVDPKNKNHAVLLIGKEDWPFAIPLIKKNGKWFFDTAAGRQELAYRHIGGNELDAIEICHGFVEAQEDYAEQKHDDSKVNQYAQRIISSPGKQDGLAWQNKDGKWEGPIGENVAKAIEKGYSEGQPYHGYYFKVLKGQGPAAPLGEMDYVVKGAMIGGFALAAAPAQYGVTGIKTFIVANDGVVYEKDFGEKTPEEFKKLERFNPDETWSPVEEQE
jgi:Protein of unknown function (DUF2950)